MKRAAVAWAAMLGQQESDARRLREISDYVGALSEAIHPPRVAEVVVAHALRLTGARAALLAHLEGSPPALETLVAVGFEGDVSPLHAPLQDAARSAIPMFMDERASPDVRPPRLEDGTLPQSLAFLPMMTRRRPVAALALAFDSPAGFDAGERALMELVAAQGALALERSKLHALEWSLREAAEEEGARFRTLVQELDAIFWEGDPVTFEFSFVSQRAEKLLGYPVADWLQPGFWASKIHPDDRDWAVPFCAECTRDGQDHAFEYRMVAADGRVVWLRDVVYVLRDEEGKPSKLRGVMVDITNMREADRNPITRVARRLIRGRWLGVQT